MKQNIKSRFNLSYSSWSTFKESELQGYFQYIEKAEKTNAGVQVYGDVGNVVHKSVEDYINTRENTFDKHWDNYKIDYQRGMGGAKLSKSNYITMYNKAINLFIDYDNPNVDIEAEQNFKFEFHGMTIKGQIDLVFKHAESDYVCLLDWKTNSKNTYELHKAQRLFYSWAYWKVNGIIPETQWIYLKEYGNVYGNVDKKQQPKGIHCDNFTESEIIVFEKDIIKFIDLIEEKGYNIEKYEVGNWKGPFNNYRNLCSDFVNKLILKKNHKITLRIKGHYVFLDSIDPVLEQGIDFSTKFDLKDKYYMQKRARENNRGIIDIEDIGVYHLYNKTHKCFPIGILKKVREIISEYAQHYQKSIEIEVIDYRDQDIMNKRNKIMPDKLIGVELRDYQSDSADIFMVKEQGIIQQATGGGKTVTAAEIIRRLDANTLWIIDRKELLEQTKEALEKFLGVEVGVIMGKKCELNKPITIATIQSLNSKMSEIKQYLSMFNFVIVDEFHKAAAESYQKVFAKLPNAKYKLGLTATPTRDDGKEPILFSILGDIIYKITSKELIEQGHLVMPEINFIRLKDDDFEQPKEYFEEYVESIVENCLRNRDILRICCDNRDEKIMILTKSVEHGKIIKSCLLDSFHIHGTSTKKSRETSYKKFKKGKSGVLIITSSIGAEGLDIPDLDIIINAGANKGDVKSIQILGRALRKSDGKTTAKYYDFVDIGKSTYKHSMARMKIFRSEGYKINIITEK